jgi:hypothetical protein
MTLSVLLINTRLTPARKLPYCWFVPCRCEAMPGPVCVVCGVSVCFGVCFTSLSRHTTQLVSFSFPHRSLFDALQHSMLYDTENGKQRLTSHLLTGTNPHVTTEPWC